MAGLQVGDARIAAETKRHRTLLPDNREQNTNTNHYKAFQNHVKPVEARVMANVVDIYPRSIFNCAMERKTSNLFLVMIVFLVLSLYIPINRFTNSSGHIYNFRIDARIPFIPMAILPYLSFFLLLPWTLFVFLAERERLYREMAYSIMSACAVSYTVYFVYQTTIIRPNVASLGLINELVSLVYLIDPPYSCFPSLHTSISTILAVYWLRSPSRVKYFVLPWALVIIMSTLMTKQHHLLDVIGGIALGAVISLVAAKLRAIGQGESTVSAAESKLRGVQAPSSS